MLKPIPTTSKFLVNFYLEMFKRYPDVYGRGSNRPYANYPMQYGNRGYGVFKGGVQN